MRALLLFAALAGFSAQAFGQETKPRAQSSAPSGPYTDAASGFVFPPQSGPYRRGGVSNEPDTKALWVDYGGITPEAKASIRIILRQRPAGTDATAFCNAQKNQALAWHPQKARPFVRLSDLHPPQFAGFASSAFSETLDLPQTRSKTTADFYFYCSHTTHWMVMYGFMRGTGADVTAQEIAFIQGVKPKLP